MSQDNFEKAMRDLYGNMSDDDQAEALNRKEAIWQRSQPKSGRKRPSLLWLLVLSLLGLSAVAYWLGQRSVAKTVKPAFAVEVEQGSRSVSIDEQAQEAATARLDRQSELIDSILQVNQALTTQLADLSEQVSRSTVVAPAVELVRDTVFLRDTRIEQQLVELLIRDTVRLVDTIYIEEVLPTNDYQPLAKLEQEPLTEAAGEPDADRPSSVQFYFNQSTSNK